jgi:WD40 repeat protein
MDPRKGHLLQRIAGIGIACVLACPVPAAPKRPPAAPQMPDVNAFMQQFYERMGKTDVSDQTQTTDGVQVVLQTGHAWGLTAVALSNDGRYILSGSRDETAKLWDVASGQEIRTLTGFDLLGPRSVQFDADGSHMIVSDLKGIAVFDAKSGARLRALQGLSAPNAPLVSDDGRIGVAGPELGADRAPAVVDLSTGQVIWTVPVGGLAESALALSGDGHTLLTRSVNRGRSGFFSHQIPETTQELHIWDVAGGKLRAKMPFAGDGSDGMSSFTLSPDGRQLVRETVDRSLSVDDIATGKEILNIPTGATAASGITDTLLYSPDGSKIAYATGDGKAKIWEMPGGRLIRSLPASAVNFSADGRTLVLGRDGGAPSLLDLASGKETALAGGAQAIVDLTVTGDGHSVVAAMMGGGVKVWDLSTAQMERSFNCAGGAAAASVSASKASRMAVVGCLDGSVTEWDTASGQKMRELLPQMQKATATQARFSDDGRIIVVSEEDTLSIFDATSGSQLHQFKIPPGAVPAVMSESAADMSPEMLKQMPPGMRKQLEDQEAKRQEMQDSAAMLEMRSAIRTIAIHPNDRLIAIGRAFEISLWDAETGQLVRRMGGGAAAGGITNPMDAVQGMREKLDGASSLAFSPDGRILMSIGSQGKRFWNIVNGQPLRLTAAAAVDMSNPQSIMDSLLGDEMGEGGGTAFSPDGRLAAHGLGRVIKITDLSTGRDIAQLRGHTSNVSALVFVDGGRLLVSGGRDGAVRVWTVPDGKEAVALIALGSSDYVAVTPDQYYRASKSRINGVAFRENGQLYPFEQFDLRFNRPDIVLQRLGLADPGVVQTYRQAYERRLRKMGFNEGMLGTDFHLPVVEILGTDAPLTTADASLKLRVRATDDKYPLDRLNVYVNDVPVYGSAGLAVAVKGSKSTEQDIAVPLVAGRNKVQVSVLNAQGAESLKQTVYTTSTADQGPADIYVVAIGVSQYKNSAYNLRFAAKDAGDFLNVYQTVGERPAPRGQVHVLEVTDGRATRDGIRRAKDFLRQARVNDLAVVFAAGHGMTDAKQNYYFGTWDIDPAHPDASGLPYEDFENLLDGIPAMQKMLLIDTCFSGEIDKDEPTVVAEAGAGGDGTVKMRSFKAERGVTLVADSGGAGVGPGQAASGGPDAPAANLVRFQQDWFADLRRGTGAVVISSASGNEYALEGEQWHNGVFTYALLNGLKNHAADLNKDGVVTVSELQTYVIEQVRKLTAGGQNPTVRRENLDYDFAVF